ncbi:3470_t:CDS:2, partial [Dentiscutata heterogama]
EMSKDRTFSMSKSQQAEHHIFELVNENKYIVIEKKDANVDKHTEDMYKSHEFDRIPCFILSNNLNDFQLCIKNTETKE